MSSSSLKTKVRPTTCSRATVSPSIRSRFDVSPFKLRAIQDTGYTQRLSFDVNSAAEGTYWTPMIYSPERKVYGSMVYQCSGVGDCLVAAGLTGEAELKTDPK